MRNFLTIILLSFVCFSIDARTSSAEISGRIVDAESNPVMYASIALLSGEKVLTGAMSDTTGFFLIKTNLSGECTIKVSSIGYEDTARSVNVTADSKIDVGTIVIKQSTIALNGAVVSAEQTAKSISIEKTRINPGQSISASTGSVLEVIRSSSSVNVDGSDNVSIRGNSNVLILVDGVPTTLGGLGSIPAADVLSIDIVTSPDVKYDSEGTGGIISIVSKKQVSGSFSSMAALNYGFDGFVNGNLAMSCNNGRWGVRANFNGRYEKDLIESEMHRQIKSTGNTLDQIISATKRTANYNAGVNLNFKATKKDILTLDFKAIFPRMNNFQNFNNHYVNGGTPGDIFRQTDITFNRETFEGSLGYRHIFEPGRKELSLTCTISQITGHRPSYYYEERQMVQRSVSGGHPFNTSFQADYLSALGKGKFETGIKMTYRHNDIDHKMYELNPETGEWELSIPLSNDLVHSEYIPAAYAMYSSKLSEKLSYKAGLRLEYSYVTLHSEKEALDTHSDCFFFAPNFMFNYGISEKWTMNLGFSRRISRPTYPQLNPYINLIDRQTYETGNMNLQPEKANKLDLGYSYHSKILKVNGNAYFNHTAGYITQVSTLKGNILVISYINGDMDMQAGIDHNISIAAAEWISFDIATNTWYTCSKGSFDGAGISNGGWVNNSNASLNLKPCKGMTAQLQYFVTTPQYFPQFTTSTIHYCNIGLKQSFLRNSLSVSALLTDVFNTRRWDIHSDNQVYTLVNCSKNLSRMFWLGISWNFNAFKPAKAAQHKEVDRSVIRLGD